MSDLIIAGLVLAIWLYLVFAHGGFWRGREAEQFPIPEPVTNEDWPPVVAVIPARNEIETLPRCLASLLAQTYPGDFSIVVVDDQSDDGTGDLARNLADGASRNVIVLSAPSRPPAWTGKVWAQHTGVTHIEQTSKPAKYLLLTDADITYEPQSLIGLVRAAEKQRAVLVSLMAKLNCTSVAEHALVPAFIYFFQMLYPFQFANQPRHPLAAAAGGCMLIDRAALSRAGGLETIRSALIDDCTLAGVMKRQGPIWLGLAKTVRSIREYPGIADIRAMVSRSAYAQLRYSPLLLVGTTFGLILVFLAAPILIFAGSWPSKVLATCAYFLMFWSYQPTLRYYSRHWAWGLLVPLVTVLYLQFTLDSAYQHWRGRGGMWKGRAQAAQGNDGI